MTLAEILDKLAAIDNLDEGGAGRWFAELVGELENRLEELGKDLEDRLCASLHHQHRAAAAILLARRGRDADVPLLAKLLEDSSPRVRRQTARALVARPREALAPNLMARALEVEPAVQLACIDALVATKDKAASGVLGHLLKDANADVKSGALAGLKMIGLEDDFATVAAAMVVGDDAWNTKVCETLARITRSDRLVEKVAELPEDVWKTGLGWLEGREPTGLVAAVKQAYVKRKDATVDVTELSSFGLVLSDDERDADVHGKTFEREELLLDLLEQLEKEGNRSFVLVGEPGVGKTNLIHELGRRAHKLARPWTLLETSTSEIMVGTKYIGEWETKLRDLIGKAKSPRRVILYITNINDLQGAGTTSSNKANFAELMGPYIRRGEITVIGESTSQALSTGLEKDGAIKRLFQYVNIDEPPTTTVSKVMKLRLEELSAKSKIDLVVAQDVVDLIVDLSGTYYSGMAQPGRSITLLNQVIQHRMDAFGRTKKPGVVEITAEDVIAALARFTGLPERLLNDRRPLDPQEVRGFFEERVLGQFEATTGMVDLITLIKAGLTDPGKPLGVLFFVGPTGVGKTEIAKTLAEFIFGSDDRMIRIDLSEYKDYESFEKLIGGTYRNTEGGLLTQKVREQPFSVILLDEFEKAHPNIFDLFLQVFDDGRLTDARGRTADFRHTIVIMTSNLGSGIGVGGAMGFGDHGDDVPSEEKVLKEVRKFFRPEFVNRIDRIVVFKPLSSDVMRKIVRRELGKVVLRSGILRRHLLVDIEPDVVDLLMAQGFSQAYGARPLKRRVEQLVLLPLAREIVAMSEHDKGALLQVFVEDGKVAVRRHKTREVSRQEQVAERLKLRAPDGEKVIGVKPTELPGILEKLAERIARLRAQSEAGRYAERKSEIVAETATPTFWDDPQQARKRLAELAHLEDLLEALDAGSRQLDDVADFARAYQRHGQSIRARFEEAYEKFLERLVALEYKFLGESDEDRQDVFLSLKRIGDGKEAAEAVETMQRMYLAWAERRGFGVSWLHRRDDEHGPLESTWLLEGISLYGLLKGEDGLHRFELGGKGAERRAAFVRADVLPRPDGERRIARKDVRVERGAKELVLVHTPTGTSVEASPLSDDLDEDALHDLLDARVADRAGKRDADRLVRRYNIEGKFIRDEETGAKAGQRDLLAGGLDELLRARLFATAP